MKQTAYTVLAEATRQAAVEQLLHSGYDVGTIDCEKLTQALKDTFRDNLTEIQEEWKNAIEARMGEAMLKEIVNTQANSLALKANQLAGYL